MAGPRSNTFEPIHLPEHLWEQHRDALTARDVGVLFHMARRHDGASQNRISMATGVPQRRVNVLMNRKGGTVVNIEVLHRIADVPHLPDHDYMPCSTPCTPTPFTGVSHASLTEKGRGIRQELQRSRIQDPVRHAEPGRASTRAESVALQLGMDDEFWHAWLPQGSMITPCHIRG